MRCNPRHFRQAGLTLVELLVAISVLAFVAVLGWRGLDSITRTRSSLNAELEQTRGMQLAFAQLQNDCANSVDASKLDGRLPIVIDAQRITLARSVHSERQSTRLQLVTYRLRDGDLTRQESPPTRDLQQLDQFWQLAQTGAGTPPIRLQSGVQSMVMRVWINDGRGWRSWDAAAINVPTSRGSLMNPQAGTTGTQTVWSGLEVSLGLAGRDAGLSKIFLLGAV